MRSKATSRGAAVPADGRGVRAAAAGTSACLDPATHPWCTLGGMIGNNSCGVHSVMADLYGDGPTTAHNVSALEVLTYRGLRMHVGAVDGGAYRRAMAEGGLEPAERLDRRHRTAPARRLGRVLREAEDQHHIWEIRESGLAATAHVEGEHPTWPGWEDSAVPPERFGEYLRDMRALFE